MRYRIFAANDASVEPVQFLGHLVALGLRVTANFRGDRLGWYQADLVATDDQEPIKLERFLSSEEGLRNQLNTWAAWLETVPEHPQLDRVWRHLIGARQVFTLSPPPDYPLAEICLPICHYLARQTEGIYQWDGQGFFAADGELLLKEE